MDLSESAVGSITKLENAAKGLDKRLEKGLEYKAELTAEYEKIKSIVDVPFEHEEELSALTEELARIDIELDLGRQETPIVMDEEQRQPPQQTVESEYEESYMD